MKANFGIYPFFAGVYLLIIRYDWKRLLKQGLILAGVMLIFLIPWTVRNYIQFDAFIPLTYGAGNPALLGTYQGIDYPLDEDLDYETNVTDIVKEKYAAYYDDNGNVMPQYERYVALGRDAIKASYRRSVWIERDIKKYLYSTFVMKPNIILDGIFYGTTIFNISSERVAFCIQINTVLCVLSLAAAVYLRRFRAQMGFFLLTYMGNVLVYAVTFAYGRYNYSLMPLRMMMLGLGAGLFVELLRRALKTPLAGAEEAAALLPEPERDRIENRFLP